MSDIREIHIQKKHWESMRSHILSCLPNEACGILAGTNENVSEVFPVANELNSPVRFRMDPVEQLNTMLRIEELEQEMIGIFHSHVRGPSMPSNTDLEEAYYPELVYLIWFPMDEDWDCRAFRLIEGTSIEIPILISPE